MVFNHYTRDELIALAAANAPNPSRAIIEMYHDYDISRNPDSDPNKPKWRTEIEIVADYKIDFAQTMMQRLKERQA